jgi:hypothetical protein
LHYKLRLAIFQASFGDDYAVTLVMEEFLELCLLTFNNTPVDDACREVFLNEILVNQIHQNKINRVAQVIIYEFGLVFIACKFFTGVWVNPHVNLSLEDKDVRYDNYNRSEYQLCQERSVIENN